MVYLIDYKTMKLLTIQQIIERNNLKATNSEKGEFAEKVKSKFKANLHRVKEKHYGCKVWVNAYPEVLEEEILKLSSLKKKRQRICN